MLESIERYRELFLATYTVQADDAFYGYAKIFPDRPESVWDTAHAIRKVASGSCAAAHEAHDKAREAARRFLDRVFDAAQAATPDPAAG